MWFSSSFKNKETLKKFFVFVFDSFSNSKAAFFRRNANNVSFKNSFENCFENSDSFSFEELGSGPVGPVCVLLSLQKLPTQLEKDMYEKMRK